MSGRTVTITPDKLPASNSVKTVRVTSALSDGTTSNSAYEFTATLSAYNCDNVVLKWPAWGFFLTSVNVGSTTYTTWTGPTYSADVGDCGAFSFAVKDDTGKAITDWAVVTTDPINKLTVEPLKYW